jgi:hypothetical protein
VGGASKYTSAFIRHPIFINTGWPFRLTDCPVGLGRVVGDPALKVADVTVIAGRWGDGGKPPCHDREVAFHWGTESVPIALVGAGSPDASLQASKDAGASLVLGDRGKASR